LYILHTFLKSVQVIEVKRPQLFRWPVCILDFISLYPSIMIAYNMCYTTYLNDEQRRQMDPKDYFVTPSGKHAFVRPHILRGVLPEILAVLLSERKKTKAEMKTVKDEFYKMVLDGRQGALKISANSVYGFTGAHMLPLVAIAESVTEMGRFHLNGMVTLIKNTFNTRNNYDFDADIPNGDTDSVFIFFGEVSREEAKRLGFLARDAVNKSLAHLAPIQVDFEKIFDWYLLLVAKHYAGKPFALLKKAPKT